MCLLILAHQLDPSAPLIVAANRDELLSRPAEAMALLHPTHPRLLGGRDGKAGGTWMATSDTGLVIALTNRPGARHDDRRSRGELPLRLAGTEDRGPGSAVAAARRAQNLVPSHYSPCWLFVADRSAAFYVDLTGETAAGDVPVVRRLAAGVHVLENHPLDPVSPKAALVRVRARAALSEADRVAALFSLLASHDPASDDPEFPRPPELRSPCVHFGPYGTRSSTVVIAHRRGAPEVHYTSERPCDAIASGSVREANFGGPGGLSGAR